MYNFNQCVWLPLCGGVCTRHGMVQENNLNRSIFRVLKVETPSLHHVSVWSGDVYYYTK